MSRRASAALVVIPALFLGYFFLYPLAAILGTGLTRGGVPDLGPFDQILDRPRLLGVAWFTLWQAVASTLLTLVVALPAAAAVARYSFAGKRLFRALVTVPFVLPTVVVASAFLALVGRGGVLGLDLSRSIWAILAAHVFYNVAVVIRTVGTAWERLDPRLEEAAMALGATRAQAFRRVTWPLLRSSVVSASSIVFLFTFTSFGVVLILGGFQYATLEVEIWRQATALLDLPLAAALSLLQLLGVGAILFAYARSQERRTVEVPMRASHATQRPPRTPGQRAFVAVSIGGLVTALGAPLAVLVERSLRTGDGY
ncbi:MAG: ABC transporter permease, partial [Acidimicrobiia bacterium]